MGAAHAPGANGGHASEGLPALPYAARHRSQSSPAFGDLLAPGGAGFGNPAGLGHPGGLAYPRAYLGAGLEQRGSSGHAMAPEPGGAAYGGLLQPPALPSDWHAGHMVRTHQGTVRFLKILHWMPHNYMRSACCAS